ncbi:MAG: hypothetical protein U0401_00140 [Anaerolineae bacterium]
MSLAVAPCGLLVAGLRLSPLCCARYFVHIQFFWGGLFHVFIRFRPDHRQWLKLSPITAAVVALATNSAYAEIHHGSARLGCQR